MKSLLIIAIILIIGGAVWYSVKQPPTVEAPATVVTPVQTKPTPAPTTPTPTPVQTTPTPTPATSSADSRGMTAPAPAKVFTLSGKNFSFNTSEIRVKKGDMVTINFTSADGFHDVVIDEFSAKTERVRTGGTSSMTFVANKAGTFEYYCSVGQHRMNGMVGKLVVE